MSRSGQKKEKYGSSDLSLDNCNDGTAARTRPLSFHEIIIRRKNKKSPEEIKEAARGSENKSGDCTIENVSDHRESERHHKHNIDSSDGVDKHFSEGVVKLGSQGKEDTIPPNGSNSVRRDRERRESEKKIRDDSLPKHKHREVLRSEIRLKDGSLAKENNTGESCRSEIKLKAEMKEKFTKDKGKVDKQILGLGKNYEWPSENSKDVAVKKHSRDLTGKDRHEGRSGEKSERESKRKHRSGNDEKNGDGNAVKKHDLLKRRDSEISERRERKESQKSHYGESRLKRMRSRSREREERNRRLSISVSPKAHRHTSYHGREHEELFAHSSKGRSGRHHSDIDRSRGTSNGSNNHYSRWHGGSTSGLGGYSPRKRRTDAAVKTPSPVSRSPEKKSAKWDVAPSDSNTVSDPVPSTFQMSNQNASVNADELVRATSLSSSEVKPLDVASVSASLTRQNISIYSHQLTQATKPLRSLYVDNVPASVSEKAVIEFLNNFLLSSGADQIRGSQPCISCVIQKDKGQAVIEFLTPEDATAALSCDGISFFGSILKIRRPKDFVEVANGEEKSVAAAAADAISDTVKDSPHKIFIGGISKTFSSKMIMEIASAFGPLKAFHFEVNEDHDEPCAFLEYVDRSVTQKACVGLNGMKLGGQVLTVVQAILDGSSLENNGSSSFYGIPEHAVPLLEKPTQVLKLKNVFNQEGLSSLSDLEVEEVLEDVRLECARFGTVKSVNVVKYGDSNVDNLDMCEVGGYVASAGIEENLRCNERNVKAESLKEAMDNQSEEIKGLEFPLDAKEVKEVEEGNRVSDNNPVGGVVLDEPCPLDRHDSNMAAEGLMRQSLSKTLSPEAEQPNTLKDGTCCHEDKVACRIEMDGISLDNKLSAEEELNLDEVNRNLQEASAGFDGSVETHSDSIENGGKEKQDNNLARIFEQGCVFVEYRRTEASCTAAHCLHGRLFDDRIVTVEYVPLDLYKKRFTK